MTELPPAPTYFHKPVSALNAHESAVVRPKGCKWLNYEGEIAIVIGRTATQHLPEEAGDYIRGYSIGNDYRAARLPRHRLRRRCCGSRAPTRCAPSGRAWSRAGTSGTSRSAPWSTARSSQDGNTDEMKWDMHYLVADIARTITLQPGDVLLSGTPAISRTVYPATWSTVEVEGLGTLRNHIVEGRPRSAQTWAPSPPRARRCSPPPRVATGSSAASANRTCPTPTDQR